MWILFHPACFCAGRSELWSLMLDAICAIVRLGDPRGLYTTRGNFYRQPPSMHLPTVAAGFMAAVTFVKLEAWIKATGFKFLMLHIIAIRVAEAVGSLPTQCGLP
ncbi:hypothetical protein GQ600_26631 [Phytophthora cactorum]|nr:hypothetical protein GQ600_26631 [Phytophthora cactorum]